MPQSDQPLTGRERTALRLAARYSLADRPYWHQAITMRQLAARGLVERHPVTPGSESWPAWQVTPAGLALAEREVTRLWENVVKLALAEREAHQ